MIFEVFFHPSRLKILSNKNYSKDLVVYDLPRNIAFFCKSEERIRRVKSLESTIPPVTTHGPITIIADAFVFHGIL